ncbi:helix-turn-helix transcriptional regulator [Streptomyces resistomycificus]|uniref:LuxR family transcriptional regulator n=1 Tax=Streptomyces resistomycificus TaxID=67356 RepID=A0A0L8KR99_9ACTN|nr:helix-turn-helix transcriptional regulator [Streptomyces resistomycificus]KOG28244.1 LuxR family transcriptional regulator [Streptomyces resistomycificus]KUN98130.1 LuxR family transcriptional regulator [Streptomyces resistomycificus]
MTTPVHQHGPEELCSAGLELYGRALREGLVPEQEAAAAPCLLRAGLLRPDLDDTRWLRPVAPALALPRLLRGIAEDIARRRQAEALLAEAFEPFMGLGTAHTDPTEAAGITLLSGSAPIDDAIRQAMLRSSDEVLTIQPGGKRPVPSLALAFTKEQEILARGARMRTLYQHTSRHDPAVLAHYELLDGDVEVRTLDEVPERLIVLDREIAFIPANPDRTIAVEVRHRPLVTYLATTFDRLWPLATPMYPRAVQQPALNGITPRQRAIAALLVEGRTDAVIAERLGMNIRTAREHIAKLASTFGSESRAQLGYLIGRSGILEQEG